MILFWQPWLPKHDLVLATPGKHSMLGGGIGRVCCKGLMIAASSWELCASWGDVLIERQGNCLSQGAAQPVAGQGGLNSVAGQ